MGEKEIKPELNEFKEPIEIETPWFAEVSMRDGVGAAITSGDFDGDGHRDFIIIYEATNKYNTGRISFYKGNGNLTLKPKVSYEPSTK